MLGTIGIAHFLSKRMPLQVYLSPIELALVGHRVTGSRLTQFPSFKRDTLSANMVASRIAQDWEKKLDGEKLAETKLLVTRLGWSGKEEVMLFGLRDLILKSINERALHVSVLGAHDSFILPIAAENSAEMEQPVDFVRVLAMFLQDRSWHDQGKAKP
jgi:hypothetical protein